MGGEPPPLGSVCWGGRSSTLQTSSPVPRTLQVDGKTGSSKAWAFCWHLPASHWPGQREGFSSRWDGRGVWQGGHGDFSEEGREGDLLDDADTDHVLYVVTPTPWVSSQQLLGPFHGARGQAQQRVELHWQDLLRFFVSWVPHLLGDTAFLRDYNLLAPPSVRTWWMIAVGLTAGSPPKFVMGMPVSMLTSLFLLVDGSHGCEQLWAIGGASPLIPQGSSLDPPLEGPHGVGPTFLQHPPTPHLSTTKCHQNPALPRITWTTWKNTATSKQ